MTNICTIGIDPGIRGGYAYFIDNGPLDDEPRNPQIVELSKDPKFENFCACMLSYALLGYKLVAYLENMGRSRNMKLVKHHDLIQGILIGKNVETHSVTPNKWQCFFGLGGKQGPEGCTESQEYRARKKAHIAKGKELGAETPDEAVDAMLIAIYGFNQEMRI